MDKELQKQLQLTTEDLRFADMISSRVEETVASGEFLESTGICTGWSQTSVLYLWFVFYCLTYSKIQVNLLRSIYD